MRRSVFTFTLVAAVALTLSLLQPATVRAAEVTLTSGCVVVNCTGNPTRNTGRIDLTGPDFNLHFTYNGSSSPCSPSPVFRSLTGGPATDGVFALVTFQGVTTMFPGRFSFLSFDETSISGTVEGITGQFQPLFTVNFSGTGVGSFSDSRSEFQVVPEPATIALLSVGAAALGAARRYKSRRTLKSRIL